MEEREEESKGLEITSSNSNRELSALKSTNMADANEVEEDEEVVKPIDVMQNGALKSRLKSFVEKFIIPTEENFKDLKNLGKDQNYEAVYKAV